MNRLDLIDALVEDLEPVRAAPSTPRVLIGCSLFAWVGVGAAILWTGQLRDGALSSLTTSPRYAIEWALTAGLSIAALFVGLEWGVPGRVDRKSLIWIPIVLFVGWLGLLAYGLTAPALSTGRLGARPYCDVQTALFALPALVLALLAIDRRALYSRAAAGWWVGLGAAAVPVAWMQLACLYDPLHSLTHHVLPAVVVAAFGAVAAHRLLRRV